LIGDRTHGDKGRVGLGDDIEKQWLRPWCWWDIENNLFLWDDG